MKQKIEEITLDEQGLVCYTLNIQRERETAIRDLLEDNYFAPLADIIPPYHLHISKQGSKFVFNLGSCSSHDYQACIFIYFSALSSYIKDYFSVCDNYFQGVRTLPYEKVEALDMARRAIHDEAAIKLKELLKNDVDMDKNTAKRLFTLICVLHIRN